MEIVLTRQTGSKVAVTCDGQPSHTFDLLTLIPNDEHKPPHPLEDPVAYGRAVYAALFPPETPAHRRMGNAPERVILVTSDNEIDTIPWEYIYGSYGPADASNIEGFLVLECHFVRGLPVEQRIAPPKLERSPHIIAIPSNPLSHLLEPLNIDGEWLRLREALQDKALQDYAITLERTRPPTLEHLGRMVANQQHRIVHFMGHGGQNEQAGAILCFEKDNGDLDLVTAKDFTRQVRGSVFLITLNDCASATPGETQFSNLAAALVRQKTPYALGMRFSIPDDDALTLSRTFYSYLVRNSSVEEAVYRVRLALARNEHRPWMVGMPVLYTALSAPATGFPSIQGTPQIEEHQPRIEAIALPRAEGTFQGRADDLKALGDALTGDPRRRIVTIHGGAGQGKTMLAREAVERFAYAWPGGVWATTFEILPTREVFVNDLARFLGITPDPAADLSQLERQVLSQLDQRRVLIVLDNAETLVDAVEKERNTSAMQLAELVKQLPGPTVSLLITSRVQLGWPEEALLELGGLSPEEGAALFRQSAPQRLEAIDLALAQQLSRRVDGHPLSLRLLGGAFNASAIPLPAFFAEYEAQLVKAENKYVGEHHRQRSIYASIETSVRYLDENHRHLLSGLWLFHAPFLPETAAQIFDLQAEYVEAGNKLEGKDSPFYDRLHTLWRRGLLNHETITVRERTLLFYRLPQTMRPYIEQFLASENEREALLAHFGVAYARLIDFLRRELDRGGIAAATALLLREDLERGASCVTGVEQGYYWLHLGWVLQRLGYRKSGLELTLLALEVGQEQDQGLKLQALNNLALIYQQTGQPREALRLYQQALPLWREAGDHAGEAATLNNMAGVHIDTGHPREALKLYEQALPLTREVDNHAGEAATLSNMAAVYQQIGQPQEALRLYEQALLLTREVDDRAGEATSFNNMAAVYQQIGQPQEALRLYEQALPLMKEVGNRAGEAATLSNMAAVYQQTGHPQQALRLYEQALPLMKEVDDRAGEAATLSNLAAVYQQSGRPQQALRLYEQALPLRREVGDRAGEASTLSNLAAVYQQIGQSQEALQLYEQALPLRREVDDRAGEAATLSNMAAVHQQIGQLQEALQLYEQALPLRREVGDRAGEAATLNGLAYLYQNMQRYEEAREAFEQSIALEQQVSQPAGEIAGLFGLALLLYQHMARPKEAISKMEQALAVLATTGLPNDAAGHTKENVQQYLQAMNQGIPLSQEMNGSTAMEAAKVQRIVHNTIEVLTVTQDRLAGWRKAVANFRQEAEQRGSDWQIDVDFFSCILQILDGKPSTLPTGHPYAQALTAIQEGIAAGRTRTVSKPAETLQAMHDFFNAGNWKAIRQIVEKQQAVLFQPEVEILFQQNIAQAEARKDQLAADLLKLHLSILRCCKVQGIAAAFERIEAAPRLANLPFDAEMISCSIEALTGGPEEKLQHVQYLTAQASQTSDEGLKALIKSIQLALVGSPLVELGQNLEGVYRQAWLAIVVGVERAGEAPR